MKDLLVILLWQFVINGQQMSNCNDDSMIHTTVRQGPLTNNTYEVFVGYCSGGSWYYLCSGDTAWKQSLATVACRQQGFSDQGAMLGVVVTCNQREKTQLKKFFRLTQECVGTETNLEQCPGQATIVTSCQCTAVASITCQARDEGGGDTYTTTTLCQQSTEATSPQSENNAPTMTSTTSQEGTTTLQVQDDTTGATSPQSENITLTVTSSTSQEGTTTQQVQDDTTIIAALAAVISFLLVVVTVTLIIVCIIVFRKKTLAINQQSNQGPSTKNESYSLRHQNDPVYDEASSTQPNYSSLGPTYDMEAENNEATSSNDYIQQPQGTNNTQRFKAANCTPVRREASENDFFDAEQHTYAVVNVNKKKRAKKKMSSSAADNEEHTADVQETPANPTPVRDEASNEGDDFYDAEEHTYSAVNVKQKKRGNEKTTMNGEGERKEDY